MATAKLTKADLVPHRDGYAHELAKHKTQAITETLAWIQSKPAGAQPFDWVTVTYLMTEARQLIEMLPEAERGRYRWLRLYCHMCVHARALEGDKVLFDLLDEIATSIESALSKGGVDVERVIHQIIPGALAPTHVRPEIKALFGKWNIPTDIFDVEEVWQSFVHYLCHVVLWKRIGIPIDVVVDELNRMGGLVDKTPALPEVTKEEMQSENARRALKYFRQMATTIGFPAGVPLSLQLVPKTYMFSVLRSVTPEVRKQLDEIFLGHVCWIMEVGRATTMFAPGHM